MFCNLAQNDPMNYLKALFSLVLIAGLAACATDTNENSDSAEEMHEHSTSEEIVLNNGKKWHVDENMMAFIRAMEEDVLAYPDMEETSDALKAKLQENLDNLTSNCTMKGQAHDELHKWLLPYIDQVDQLGDDEEWYAELQESFKTFNTYFE